jgi:MFS family permease
MPRDFFILIAVRFCFVLAIQMQAVLLGWQMWLLTKNPLFLGLIGLAEAIPAIGFALYAGYYVDIRKPIPVLHKLLLVSLFSAFLMFFGQRSSIGLPAAGQIGALFVSSFLTGAVRAFSHPTNYTLVPSLVSRELLPKAAAISSSTMQVARISGPAMGGLLSGFLGVSNAAAILCGLLITSFLLSLQLSISPEAANKLDPNKPISEDLLLGAKFVWRHSILFPAMLLDMVSVFLGGVTALLPIYASEILHAGSKEFGLLRAAPAIGAFLSSIALICMPIRKDHGKFMFGAVAGFGVSICVFAMSRDIWLSAIALIASGAFDSVSVIIRMSAIQLTSPDAIRGRISSVNSVFVSSSNELGEFQSGITAALIGAVNTAIFGGVACLATVLIMLVRYPALRKLDLTELALESSAVKEHAPTPAK